MEKVNIPLAKRIFDIVMSFLLIILFSPFIAVVLLLMGLEFLFISESRGSIFYSEIRISAGRPFRIYKFRIFKKHVLENILRKEGFIHTKKLERDKHNLTYTGRLLKQIYMDELPQLFNVLKGDMSLVGPRPTNIANAQQLYEEGCYSKFLIKAGLMGTFQLYKIRKGAYDQEATDLKYIDFCRKSPGWKIIWNDFKIIILTIWTVLRAEGI
jgi:lipopolysaccharide/colanic/teichoic acid biosynthesis glycosyltransferase